MAGSGPNYVKNVGLIGANGTAGTHIFKALLESQKFNVTIITRTTTTIATPTLASDNSRFPDSPLFKLFQGSYDDREFLVNALVGIDVLVLALGLSAVGQYQIAIIEAAIEAGVEWILPSEYGGDAGNPAIRKLSDSIQNKTTTRETIERLGGKWIGVQTGLWLEGIINTNIIGINAQKQTATLYNNGVTKLSTTTLPLLGTAITQLLSLPITSTSTNPNPAQPNLSSYKNTHLYIRSYRVSQLDLLRSIQRHTRTTDSDWELKFASTEEFVERGKEKGFRGEVRGWMEAYVGMCLLEGGGGDFEGKAGVGMRWLGLGWDADEEGGLDEVVGGLLG